MAVSVLARPKGAKLGACVSATIDEDYSGYATVNKTSHGLTEGQYVYVQSNVENYNGFWTVHVVDGHLFFLEQYPGGPYVAFVVNADITYCPAEFTHTWSCVHLPIVYILSSNLWPTNSADTARTVVSFTDDNGYVNLNLSGALKGSVFDLDYVKISGAASDEVNGVWQIKDAVSTSDVTINLAYDAGYIFTGATVQYYYNNYHIKVRVYGGLNATHSLTAFKPYELLATLAFIPDSNGDVKFSISEVLKSQINTRNNLQLATLPNNLDFFTQFYISYAESYDQSDGTDITTYTSSYTSDQSTFEGYAVNAKLPFKNQYSGHLTEYVGHVLNEDAKWLTLFTTPVYFEGKYFDLSFLNNSYTSVKIKQTHKQDGAILTTDTTTYAVDTGLLRIPISSALGDQICVQAFVDDNEDLNLSTWVSRSTSGTLIDWTTGSTPNVSLSGGLATPEVSEIIYQDYDFIVGEQYTVTVDYTITGGVVSLSLRILNDAFVTQFSDTDNLLNNTSGTISVTFTATSSCTKIGVDGSVGAQQNATITLTSAQVDVPELPITEELCISVDEECANQEYYLTWINYLGGFDYWNFTAKKEYQIDVTDSQTTKANIFQNWPNSYGSYADTIEKQTFRDSRDKVVVRSQYLTLDQLNAIKYIRTSPLVQVVTSRSDKRTVIIDQDSFAVYNDGDKLYSIEFTISFTNNIPSQTV